MCGILGIFGIKGNKHLIRQDALKRSRILRHRGPDESGIYFNTLEDGSHVAVCHERLIVVDPFSKLQ
jgi:asparagine synthase (glutamine-hydrolysing)